MFTVDMTILNSTFSNGEQTSIIEVIEHNLRNRPELRTVEDLLKNADNIEHKPYYQRNYVWDVLKASYFIESILTNCEISPLILFKVNGDKYEMIDGLQRYLTLMRFYEGKFKLNGKGLTKLRHLAGYSFYDLGEEHMRNFKQFVLRIYEFELHRNVPYDEEMCDMIKREIFTRYNMGVTPLTKLEVFKAQFINDGLNNYFKQQFEDHPELLNTVISIFDIRPTSMQSVLKKIRQLLVLHCMPIYTYSYKKSEANRIYEHFATTVNEQGSWVLEFNIFKTKLNYLLSIKSALEDSPASTVGQIFECLFWGLSICSKDDVNGKKVTSERFKKKLVQFILKEQDDIIEISNYRVAWVNEMFTKFADFFSAETGIDFSAHLSATDEFRIFFKDIIRKTIGRYINVTTPLNVSISKDALSISVSSLVEGMSQGIYRVRPHYQRGDVIDRMKSSAIIESLLLGIPIPPITIFKRKNGLFEVIDGQQRLITLVAFIGAFYIDEHGNSVKSRKHNFRLELKNMIFSMLHGKKFADLPTMLQDRLRNAAIPVIEIREENNPDFDSVDLYMRNNFKPYPIKPNTFESWSSFVDKRIIRQVKEIYSKHGDWFFCFKKNERMLNEELITRLIYFQCRLGTRNCSFNDIHKLIAMYILDGRLHMRFAIKNEITAVLTDPAMTDQFLNCCQAFELNFLGKIRLLLSSSGLEEMNAELDDILFSTSEGKSRTNFRFYTLWMVLINISKKDIKGDRDNLKQNVTDTFNKIAKVKQIDQFVTMVTQIWANYQPE